MNALESREICALRESLQSLVVQVARLSQAVEPLVRMQEEQSRLRDRVAELEGFRTAALWIIGMVSTGALARYIVILYMGGGK